MYEHWGIQDRDTLGQLADYHMGRLVQCVTQTVANKQLIKKDKYRELQKIVDDKYTAFAIKHALNKSKKIALMSVPIRMRNVRLCYFMGWMIAGFKEKFSGAYYMMRASVAQGAKRVE